MEVYLTKIQKVAYRPLICPPPPPPQVDSEPRTHLVIGGGVENQSKGANVPNKLRVNPKLKGDDGMNQQTKYTNLIFCSFFGQRH